MAQSDKTQYSFENPFNGGENLLIPRLIKWQAKSTLNKLQRQYSSNAQTNVDFEKAHGLLDSFLSRETANTLTGQNPAYAYCPKLKAKPFWGKGDSPMLTLVDKQLREHFEIIQKEYRDAAGEVQAKSIATGRRFLDEGQWKNIALGSLGNFTEQAKTIYPKTIAALEPFKDRIFSAEFIVMAPDTALPPHTDATNTYIVCHLGLGTHENCGVQVDKEIREVYEGDVIFFDQSYPHSAWNKGSKPRVNLLITLFHPDMTNEENKMIQQFVARLRLRCLFLSPLILIEYALLRLKQGLRT